MFTVRVNQINAYRQQKHEQQNSVFYSHMPKHYIMLHKMNDDYNDFPRCTYTVPKNLPEGVRRLHTTCRLQTIYRRRRLQNTKPTDDINPSTTQCLPMTNVALHAMLPHSEHYMLEPPACRQLMNFCLQLAKCK